MLKTGGIIFAAFLAVAGTLLATHWPFTQQAITASLESISSSRVRIGRFHKVFFPRPGYAAENVSVIRGSGPGSATLATIRTLTGQASWFAVLSFTHRLKRVAFQGLRISIPAHLPPPIQHRGPAKIPSTISELVADGAVLEIAPQQPGGAMLRFEFLSATVENVGRGKSMRFHTALHTPEPAGDFLAHGALGPLSLGNAGRAPVSGSFSYTHADLSPLHLIAGTLSAQGTFNGTLERINVRGQTNVPNFEVTNSEHPVNLTAKYSAIVNGVHGDVDLQSADVHFLDTELGARGSIASQPGTAGKTTSVDFNAQKARVQDLFRLFVKASPPIDAPIVFQARVVLPPGDKPFLQRVQLNGTFGITDARFTKPGTQGKVNKLSERTRSKKKESEDPERVFSDLKGHVILRRGIATFTDASFRVPGALARLEGTFNLTSEAVALRGTLAMQASLSHAAGGIKSILLKPLDPFFRKKGAGAVVHLRITGTYSHPVFATSLTGKK